MTQQSPSFLQRLRRKWTERRAAVEARLWGRDPLAHPAIRRMSERERADLPLVPACRGGD